MINQSDSIADRLSVFLAHTRPDLDDILGGVCELYRVDPDEITFPFALLPKRIYCYCAHRWAGVPNVEIGSRVGMGVIAVGKAATHVGVRLQRDPVVRDDFDLLALRIVERVMLRKRLERRAA
jgi:hypothetical protein